MYLIIIKNKETFIHYGKILSKLISKNSLFFLLGNLGIGKTTLIKSIVGTLTKYKANIKSPSYKLIEQYKIKKKNIYHIDFFKINNIKKLNEIDFLNYSKKNACFLIEWGDKIKIKNFKPDARIYLFYYSNFFNRLIIIKSNFLNFKKLFG
ncbi:MAG TPA: tRNA (adenosine(37)-N6)-threonylcarbamoyltransferase complex ATPase subunit type 1 TsaE [Candidatus Azoamicus sp. MARI]